MGRVFARERDFFGIGECFLIAKRNVWLHDVVFSLDWSSFGLCLYSALRKFFGFFEGFVPFDFTVKNL